MPRKKIRLSDYRPRLKQKHPTGDNANTLQDFDSPKPFQPQGLKRPNEGPLPEPLSKRTQAILQELRHKIWKRRMGDFQSVASQFVQYYYDTFDTNRQNLAGLYRDQSMLTFESAAIQGTAAIIEKLITLPFAKIKHQITTLDAQPANQQGGILVMVTGALLVDDEQKPMSYVQVFQLMQESGSYFVFNDMFKLVYPAA